MREAGGAGAQEWKGGGTKHCEGQVVWGGGLEGTGTWGNEKATRMCGGSSDRPSAAGEGQSANGGEGGSKTCGRHVVGSGAEASKEQGGM